MEQYLNDFNFNESTPDELIRDCEESLCVKLPRSYVQFLKLSNGGEGFIGKNAYLILWRVEELGRQNSAYRVNDYVPGLIVFGSDGGGEAFGFDTRQSEWPIVQIPFIVMEWDAAKLMGGSFVEFLEALSNS